MNVNISHAYSRDNKGDAALLSVLVNDVRRALPGSDLTILTIDATHAGDSFEGVPLEASFMYLALNTFSAPWAKGIYALIVVALTTMWAYVHRWTRLDLPLPKRLREVCRVYARAELNAAVGGGYLRGKRSISSTVELMLMIHALFMAKVLRQRVVLYSMSIGPFGTKRQERLARWGLAQVDRILVREDISMQLLERLGVADKAFRTVDCGFAFTSSEQLDLRSVVAGEDRPIVGITVRKWLKGSRQDQFERAIATAADEIVRRGMAVVFIPQVTSEHHNDDDRIASRDVRKRMSAKDHVYLLEQKWDHYQIKALYGQFDYLIGTRFHSVIFALTSYVPTIAIEYEHKTSGIMNDLGLGEWVLDIESVTSDDILRLLDTLLSDPEQYRNHLHRVLPPYVESSLENYRVLQQSAVADDRVTTLADVLGAVDGSTSEAGATLAEIVRRGPAGVETQ